MKLRNQSPRIAAATLALAGAGAAFLWNRNKSGRAERETPPAGEFVDAAGARLHFVRKGSGPPLVLLHGNGALVQDWMISGILDELATRHDVIAFDRPGFGYSTRPRAVMWTPAAQAKVIARAMARLGVERAIVVGHSLGALVAAQLALDHPDAVERLVLVSGYYYPTARIDALVNAPPALPLLGDVLRHTLLPVLGRALKPLVYRKLFAPAPVAARWARSFPSEMALRPAQLQGFAADNAFLVPAALAASRRYGELRLPVTIVTGAGDRIVSPQDHAMRLHADLPHSRLVTIEGAGHMVHQTAPDRVIEAISA